MFEGVRQFLSYVGVTDTFEKLMKAVNFLMWFHHLAFSFSPGDSRNPGKELREIISGNFVSLFAELLTENRIFSPFFKNLIRVKDTG